MLSFSGNFMKSNQCVFTSAIRKISQNYIPVKSITKHITRSTLLKPNISRCTILNSSSRVPYIANFLARNSHNQTDGDKDLLHFLKEEIAYEEQNAKDVPKYRDFKMDMNGTIVTLTKSQNGEKIQVSFDCNENIIVDDSEPINEISEDEDEDISDIVSYPTFTVTLTKSSGNTILFNCSCNTGINEDEEMDGDPDEEQYDILRFDNVQIYNEKTDDKSKVYIAETENMDGELYSMLMNTLLERGINGTFVNELIEFSTSVEHQHYLDFLKSLRKFLAEH